MKSATPRRLALLASAALLAVPSAALSAPTVSDWHGYRKSSFDSHGTPAFVVAPKVPASGKPWVWRTSFPDFHAEVDRELLARGYHIAYLGVVDLLGCDEALERMEKFHAGLLAEWKLARRPALEAVSRGGLHAYRYAARHPEKIACIYADTPVMDLKSWPLAFPGAASETAAALTHYGFKDEAELRAFRGNPVDLLEPVAKAKIPLRHVISLNDTVVPPEQNTLEARRRLEKLGHTMDIVSVAEGTAASHGHHFPLPEVYQSANFILRHTAQLPNNADYFTTRDGLANCRAVFSNSKSGRVAFVGGSITYAPGWRDQVMRDLQLRFPDTRFDFLASGVPSVGSVGHAFRLETDVLRAGAPDLVFVEAAVNDHNYDGWGPPRARELSLRGMEGVVRRLRAANPRADIVLLHFAHDDLHFPVFARETQSFSRSSIPSTIAAHEEVAKHYGCPSLDLSREVFDRMTGGQFTWAADFKGLHPSPFGQQIYGNGIARMLDAAFAVNSEPAPHPQPAPLDPASYDRGRQVPLEDAKLGSGFALVPQWTPTDGKEVRAGYGNCPTLVAEQAGAEMTLAFEGTACGLFLAAGPQTAVIEFTVDGGPVQVFDTWGSHSHALHLPWPVMLADGLKPGQHTLTVRTTARQPTRTALRVIHLLVN